MFEETITTHNEMINAYSIIDNELKRLHNLLVTTQDQALRNWAKKRILELSEDLFNQHEIVEENVEEAIEENRELPTCPTDLVE